MQETIEEFKNEQSETGSNGTHDSIHVEPLVTSHGKACIFCEWEKPTLTRFVSDPPSPYLFAEDNQRTGAPSPPYMDGTLQVNSYVSPPDLEPWNDQSNDVLECQSRSLHEIRSLEHPGQCSPEELPPLLFRWSNPSSQGVNSRTLFLAGAFAEIETTLDAYKPEEMQRQDFLMAFKNHVTRAKMKSPFISAFKSPLAPVHRALRYQERAMVTVIDPSKLGTKVFKASPLVEITNTELKNWKGFGEYLVWGEIKSSAIVCSFEIRTLEEITRVNPLIGRFLQLPLIHGTSRCNVHLYLKLAGNLKSYTGYETALQRLMELLEVPEEYHILMCHSFEEGWLKFANWNYDAPVDRSRSESSGIYPEVYQEDRQPFALPFTPANRTRIIKSESSSSYNPSENDDDSNSESSKEENQGSQTSQSPEARCPRHDTPSPPYSVEDDSDSDVSMKNKPCRKSDKTIFRSDPPIHINYAGRTNVERTPEVSDGEMSDEWPSEGENYPVRAHENLRES